MFTSLGQLLGHYHMAPSTSFVLALRWSMQCGSKDNGATPCACDYINILGKPTNELELRWYMVCRKWVKGRLSRVAEQTGFSLPASDFMHLCLCTIPVRDWICQGQSIWSLECWTSHFHSDQWWHWTGGQNHLSPSSGRRTWTHQSLPS